MADPVHGSLSAVKLASGADALQLDVDAPKDATGVTVKLLELDKSAGELTDDDLVATLTLDVAGGNLSLKKVDLPATSSKKSFRQGAVDLVVRGSDKVLRVPIVHDLAEGDQDIGQKQVELGIEVTATIEKKKVTYSSAGAGVAKTPFKTLAGGMVVTYVMSGGDGYFDAATKYWTDRCDELVAPAANASLSLEQVLESLDRPDSATFKSTIYEEVNLVTHGSVGFVIMALQKGKAPAARNAHDLKGFLAGAPKRALRRIDPKKTRIVFRGCRIGVDPCLLRQLSLAFGGAEVTGCNHLMSYGYPGQAGSFVAIERLVEHRAVWKPGQVGTWSSPKKTSELAAAVKSKHGAWSWPVHPKDASKEAHEVVLGTSPATWANKGYELYLGRLREDVFTFRWGGDIGPDMKTDAIEHVKQILRDVRAGTKPSFMADDEFKRMRYQDRILDADPATYEWSVTSLTQDKKANTYEATVAGRRTEAAARRMIALSDADPPKSDQTFDQVRIRTVVPRLANPAHFSRSPAPTDPCPITGQSGCVLD